MVELRFLNRRGEAEATKFYKSNSKRSWEKSSKIRGQHFQKVVIEELDGR